VLSGADLAFENKALLRAPADSWMAVVAVALRSVFAADKVGVADSPLSVVAVAVPVLIGPAAASWSAAGAEAALSSVAVVALEVVA
jgi:hypothetical protein